MRSLQNQKVQVVGVAEKKHKKGNKEVREKIQSLSSHFLSRVDVARTLLFSNFGNAAFDHKEIYVFSTLAVENTNINEI